MNEMTRLEKSLLVDYLKEFENYCLGKTDNRSYLSGQEKRVSKLKEIGSELHDCHLMEAAALIRCDKKQEGESLLKKYEKNRILQFRNPDFRAGFLYLAGVLTEDRVQKRNIVMQLQKLYQKDQKQPFLYWYLCRLDEGFSKNPEKKLAFLEKQWKLGCRQNLLFLETILTIRENPGCTSNIDPFLLQCYLWANRRGCITREMGIQIGKNAMGLKRYEKNYEYLLKECYRIFSTKELLGALCSVYIREGRIDQKAAEYYTKGVEYELKVNNLYEYYMMATTEQKKKLLPEQVLFHFLYHDTLNAAQKVYLYKNVISYGDPESEIYGRYREKIEKYTIESLLKKRISQEYAFLYEKMLYPQIFTDDMAQAMSELMFLRKLTCNDTRMRAVEVTYEQLETAKRIPLKKGQAYIPIYSPSAVITLIDEEGNLYRNTIPYQLEKMLDEKKLIEICRKQKHNHVGLLLYLSSKKAEDIRITEENEELYRQIASVNAFKESYRNVVILKLLEYYSFQKGAHQIPQEWWERDGQLMDREQRGKMVSFLVKYQKYAQAFSWIEDYGTVFVPANTILKILTALSDQPETEKELYYRLCYGCFCNSQMNYITLKYLSDSFLGTCGQMTEIWKQAKAYGVDTSLLEERILVQMMFTGTKLEQHFDIYLSYNQREPKEYVKKAYLTYQCQEAFVKGTELDLRFYFLLEEELLKNHGYAKVCILAYLKYLAGKPALSSKQKSAATIYLKELLSRGRYYEFMQSFGQSIPETLVLEDRLFVEYHAPSDSEVHLHYMIEGEEQKSFKYTVCRMYPVCSGIYSKSFTLFEGEKLLYFVKEKRADGSELSTPVVTRKKESVIFNSVTKYGRLNSMRECRAQKKNEELLAQARKFHYLETAAAELFTAE